MSAYTTCNLLKKPNIMRTPSGVKTDKQSHVRQRTQKIMVILLAVVKIESQTLKVCFQQDFTCHTSYAPPS